MRDAYNADRANRAEGVSLRRERVTWTTPDRSASALEPCRLGPYRIGRRRDEVAHLIEGLGASLARRCPRHAQNPHGFDVSVPRLGLATGVTRLRSVGGGDGVLGIGLALAAATLAIRAVHFDDPNALGLEVAGQPRTIRTCSFDPHQLDGPKLS